MSAICGSVNPVTCDRREALIAPGAARSIAVSVMLFDTLLRSIAGSKWEVLRIFRIVHIRHGTSARIKLLGRDAGNTGHWGLRELLEDLVANEHGVDLQRILGAFRVLNGQADHHHQTLG